MKKRQLYSNFQDWAIKIALPKISDNLDNLKENPKLDLKNLELDSVRFFYAEKAWGISHDTCAIVVFFATIACMQQEIGERNISVFIEEASGKKLQLSDDLWLQVYNLTSLDPNHKPFYVYPASDRVVK